MLLDLTKLSYPSDKLTIGMLRQKFPQLIDNDFSRVKQTGYSKHTQFFLDPLSDGHARDILGSNLLKLEREIATWAADAISEPKSKQILTRDQWQQQYELREHCDTLEKRLIDSYVQLGLAEGKSAAKELVKKIKKQATKLAQIEHSEPER